MNENVCCGTDAKEVNFTSQLESSLKTFTERLEKVATHNDEILAAFRGEKESKKDVKPEGNCCKIGRR